MSLNGMGWDGSINEDALNHPVASGMSLISSPLPSPFTHKLQVATSLWDRRQKT